MQKAVSVSVIIPTYNGFSRLRPVLSGLERQTAKVKNLEIIIVDDNSKIIDKEKKYNHLLEDYPSLNVSMIYHEENLGPAAARNTGVKKSTGDIIFFTDDDCEVPADWIDVHLSIYGEKPQVSGVGGWYSPHIKEARNNVFSLFVFLHYINPLGFSLYKTYGLSDSYPFYSFPGINTANLSIKRYVFDKILFDEDFITPGFEDKFFSEEMRKEGYLIYYIPQLIIDAKKMSLKKFLRFSLNRGFGAFVYERKYGFRYKLSSDIFKKMPILIKDLSLIYPEIKRKRRKLLILAFLKNFITHSRLMSYYYQKKYSKKKKYIPVRNEMEFLVIRHK